MSRIEGKKIALVVGNYFEQVEFTEPKKLLEQAGAVVDVLAPKAGTVQGMNHEKLGDEFPVDRPLGEVRIEDYDALLLPGGAINADHLRMDELARAAARTFMSDKKPVAAICHAPWVLVSSDVIEGKTLTSYPTIQDDIRNAGATWVDQEVCIDGNLITSRNPGDIPKFTETLLDMLDNR